MCRPNSLRHGATATTGLLAFAFTVTSFAPAQVKNPKTKHDVPYYMKQLHARFKAWDTNKDGFLDKDELAKAFRGADAKPYDYEAPSKSGATPVFPLYNKPKVGSFAVAALPPGCPANYPIAEIMTWKKPQAPVKTTPPPINPAQYPDFQFLSMIKASGDRISRKEFDQWANDYAHMVDRFDNAQHALKNSQSKLAKAKTAQGKQQAAAELQRHQGELDRAAAQLNNIPAAIHKTINIRP
jgi:hypothetical protein